ncbi:MAG: PfkB family carbohydrate kinase [Treponema sp.]|jgi:sugar/nucleoside kinase (ribokinase family)|nr:PfkB family carbohydrate kinase [Treponema sp.]
MKQTLVIGSTVVDVLLDLPRIPLRGEDVNINSCTYRLGGCAYNVYKALCLFDSPARLCSPVGTGFYGSMVREAFAAGGIDPFVNLEAENGCCYCLVDGDGERTFLSYHGAEYVFARSWMANIDYSRVDSIFICGIEVEDPSGNEIVDFVCEHSQACPAGTPELYFAPGPRILHIMPGRLKRIFACHPVLHLNETEACSFAGRLAYGDGSESGGFAVIPDVEEAAEILTGHTNNAVVITLGERGCYYRAAPLLTRAGKAGSTTIAVCGYARGFPAAVKDTVGAGDAHCGALIAARKQGKSLGEACEIANKVGAAVVGISGAALEKLPEV